MSCALWKLCVALYFNFRFLITNSYLAQTRAQPMYTETSWPLSLPGLLQLKICAYITVRFASSICMQLLCTTGISVKKIWMHKFDASRVGFLLSLTFRSGIPISKWTQARPLELCFLYIHTCTKKQCVSISGQWTTDGMWQSNVWDIRFRRWDITLVICV
jgi:hypothetical protein